MTTNPDISSLTWRARLADTDWRSMCAGLVEHADWDIPALREVAGQHSSAEPVEMALALVGYLRHRSTPVLAYTPAYIHARRAAATPAQCAAARERLQAQLEKDTPFAARPGLFRTLSAEDLHLGATPELCARIAECAAEARASWGEWIWWQTNSFCHLLHALWPLEECADHDLVPLLGWMLAGLRTEWSGAKDWHENLLSADGHNYFVTTYGGFALAGLFFPEFRVARPFQAFWPDYLVHETLRLMQPDGFTRERAGYHYGTAAELMAYAHLAEINGMALPAEYTARLREIAAAGTWKLVTPNGNIPMNGDTGACHARMRNDCASLRLMAAAYALPEGKFVAESLTADQPAWQPPYAQWLPHYGQNVWPAYRQLAPHAPPSADTCLPQSGYYVMRTDWSAAADYCFIDAGTRGNRVTSHDHAAIFNLEVMSRGEWVLIDNNSGHYGDNPARMWRVGSFAHNVATVDEEHHLPLVTEWLFGACVHPTVEHWQNAENYAYFSGIHEGYSRLTDPVICRRKVFYLRGGYWILLDRFTAAGAHAYTQHFHLAKPAHLLEDGRVMTSGAGGNLLIVPVPGAAGTALLEPNPYPLEGYDNPDHLCYTQTATGNALLATVLVPFLDDNVPAVAVSLADIEADGRMLDPWEATGLAITVNGRRDHYLDTHLSWNLPWRMGDYTGTARLFHSQCHGCGSKTAR